MKVKVINTADIPAWISLSNEYDKYVRETVTDLSTWYNGDETAISFEKYMTAKINKNEAFMAIDNDNQCYGVIAISKGNNRITFFAVAHECDFNLVGDLLICHALKQLNCDDCITVNVIKSNAEHIQKEYVLLSKYNFEFSCEELENGVPVNCFCRRLKGDQYDKTNFKTS